MQVIIDDMEVINITYQKPAISQMKDLYTKEECEFIITKAMETYDEVFGFYLKRQK